MANLRTVYNSKQTGTKVNKTYMVPFDELYLEEGYNVREASPEHVEYFKNRWKKGDQIPALDVEVTERGIKIIDGQHRYLGALEAIKDGSKILRVECKDFVGDEASKVSHMIKSSQGRSLSPLDRGRGYHRLTKLGWTIPQIADDVGRSESDVRNHLQLYQECSPYIQSLVRKGAIKDYTLALDITKKHGVFADKFAAKMMAKAESAGKGKITKSIAKPQFPAAKTKRLIELIYKSTKQVSQDGKRDYLLLPEGVRDEVMSIFEEYQKYIKGQNESQPE